MADTTPHPNGNGEPPKIKLDLSSDDTKSITGPVGDTRIPTPSGTPPRITIRPPEKKTETTRIDLSQAKPSPKLETQKVNIAEAAKAATMRVEIVDSTHKAETARIDTGAPKAPAARAVEPAAADVFKRSTVPVGVPTPVPLPPRPKTIQVRKPVTPVPEPVLTPPSPAAESEAKKSETARIDLPADTGGEKPATRPKTIRIKRPDGTTAKKALTIARPETGSETRVASVASAAEGEEVGGLFGVLALVALLLVCVLVYVLAAQTIAPTLPFPGKL